MKTDTPTSTAAPVPDKRSRNKRVLFLVGFIVGILFTRTAMFLAAYDGRWEIKLALVLAPWAVFGLVILLCRRFYQADELELFINRQALAFAFWVALFGLTVLYQLQAAGFVPVFVWTTKWLMLGLGLLFCAGLLWSRSRFR